MLIARQFEERFTEICQLESSQFNLRGNPSLSHERVTQGLGL